MTVAELIEELGKYPPGMQVVAVYEGTGSVVSADRVYLFEGNDYVTIDAEV